MFKAKGPEDVLAMVPYRLGFHPVDSLVAIALDGPRQRLGFTLRLDLPDLAHVPDLARYLVETLRHHDTTAVLLLTYAADDEVAGRLVHTLLQRLDRAGITVQDAYRSDGDRWFCYTCDGSCCPPEGTPYDVSGHPLAAEHVLEGRVALPSREDLQEQLAPVSGSARTWMRQCFDAVEKEPGSQPGTARAELADVRDEDAIRRFVADWIAAPRELTDAEIATLAIAVRSIPVRDAAWLMMRRDDAERHADLWRQVLRRVVPPYEPAVACLAAFAAWLSGNGALAWCALDRALVADPTYSWARLLTEMLNRALPPSMWEEVAGMDGDSEQWAS